MAEMNVNIQLINPLTMIALYDNYLILKRCPKVHQMRCDLGGSFSNSPMSSPANGVERRIRQTGISLRYRQRHIGIIRAPNQRAVVR